MSSISSSECRLQYGGVWAEPMESPWYPTFGQPLVYYSQVQPFRRWQRSKETEKCKHQNCFKKAFQWYTQERVPFKVGHTDSTGNMNKEELKGFAAWLDDKYNEFLQANPLLQTQTSAIEIDTANCQRFEPESRKYKRTKSPWSKRRKYLGAKEKGDVILASNQSIEVILKPKELPRPASECCHRTKVQSCCNRSSSTAESNASTLQKVSKLKSQSLTSVVKERELYVVPFDVPEYGNKKKMGHEYEKPPNQHIPKRDLIQTNSQTKSQTKTDHSKDASCQCSKDKSGKVDAYSQSENKGARGSNICSCIENKIETKSVRGSNIIEMSVAPVIKSFMTTPKTEPENSPKKEEATDNVTSSENRCPFLTIVSDSVQTSDHSINLGTNIYHEYPLFMRIICADKL